MQYLNANPGQEKNALKVFYDKAAQDYPNVFTNFPYDTYLNFLSSNLLITEENGKYYITYMGVDFLNYIINTSKNFHKIF